MEQDFSAVAEVERLRSENEKLLREIRQLKMRKVTKDEAKLLRDVQKCKIELKKQNLKKTGYNSHGKYHYFELDDFLSCVEIILNKRGLASFFNFEDDRAELTICNEDGASHTWTTKCISAKARENGFDVGVHMKSEQAIQTYARRTLWLQAMEITEPNEIESDGKEKTKQQVKKSSQKKQVTADKLIQPVREESSTEITAERIEDILRKAEKRFNNQQLKKLEKDRDVWNWENGKQYIRDLCRNEREFLICQQSVEFKQADRI